MVTKQLKQYKMGIVKTIEIKSYSAAAIKDFEQLNKILLEQEEITIELQKEQLRLEKQLQDTPKNALAEQKKLTDELNHVKDSLKDQSVSVRELKLEQKSLGDASSNLTEDLVSNGGAMGILNELTGGLAQKFKDSYEAIALSSKGLSGFKKAMVATGIGALVVGIGALVANWDKVKDALSGATAESKAYKEAQAEIISAVSKVQAEITKMGDVIELAKQGTISKEEALQQYNKALGESVGYAESLEQAESLLVKNAATVVEVTRLKAQSEVLYAKAAEARAKVIAGDESLKPDWWDTIKNATVSAFSGINGAAKFATEQGATTVKNGQDAIKTAEQLEGSAADLQTKIAELQKNLEKGSLSPQQREKRNTEIKALEDKAAAEAIQREKDKAAALESIRQALIDTEDERRNEELRKIQANYDAQIALAEQYYGKESETVLALRQAQKDALYAQQNEFDAQDKEKAEKESQIAAEKLALDKENDLLSFEEQRAVIAQSEALLLEDETINEKDRTDLQKTYSDKRKEIDQLEADFKKSQTKEIENTLASLGELAGKETAAGKALGIAAATINTFQGASEALKQESTLPSPFDVVAKIANVATVIATGLKTVKSIASVKVPNAGGGGGSVPSAPSLPAAQPPSFNVVGQGGTNQLAQVIGDQTQQPIQAYVVANDVTSAQSLQRNIQSEAGIGG
jgi:hypothetical protein